MRTVSTAHAMSLHDHQGQRKYLTAAQREAFLKAAEDAAREVRTFYGTLAYTSCRISEALALTADCVDLTEGVLTFETLKKRKNGVYRGVPVSPPFLDTLDLVHNIGAAQRRSDGRSIQLWDWSRPTAWRRVSEVMEAARITGPHATPKGLRHGFGVRGVGSGVTVNVVQRWLGHAQLTNTAIYANATGAAEKHIAERMWR